MSSKRLVESLANRVIAVMRQHRHFIDRNVVVDIEKCDD